jgi:regulator of cell morphogenesis and NO signaling
MTIIDRTLGDLVAERPGVAPTLDRLGLDYCCHGDRTVAEAAGVAGLDVAAVADALDAAASAAAGDGGDGGTAWTALDVAALADHIESTHHAYLHAELPDIVALADKVRTVHGSRHPELSEVAHLVDAIAADLEPHLAKEERILFPAIRAIAGGQRDFPFGSVLNPIRVMSQEHDAAGELLARLRSVTSDYAVPADGCASYQSLYERLEALELDTHLHIHKENHSLFPRAIEASS